MPILRRSHSDHDLSSHDADHEPRHDERAGYPMADSHTIAARQREEHGGFKLGATFFGWLVAIALTVLLAGILGAIAAAAGTSLNLSEAEATDQAGSIGLATGIATLVVLMIAYFAGGYVAGRMARFDGGRQGLGVWVFGLVVALIVAGIGAIFGSQYDVFDRVSLPSLPVSTDALTVGGIIAGVIVLLGTLIAAVLGGKAGQRYHTKVDRTPL